MKLEKAIQSIHFRDEGHKAVLNIMYTAWWLKTHISRELKHFDLTNEQYNVLRILKGRADSAMCVKDIAERMIEKGTNVPRIIDRLVRKKLVKRATDPLDKRHTVMALTPAGLQVLEQSTQVINTLSDRIIGLDSKEAGTLNRLIEKMRLVD